MTAAFPISAVRAAFPALALKDGDAARVYFDNPAGTQVPQRVIDRTLEALIAKNANLGGYFATTVAAGRLVDDAHQACADFYNAASADEIVFGQNMTTLTFHMSRCLGRKFKRGDEIVLVAHGPRRQCRALAVACGRPRLDGQVDGFRSRDLRIRR